MCEWKVSHVENHMGRIGISAVKTPVLEDPKPMQATVPRLARVQLSESMPWSNSSPRGEEEPVLRACLPSMLSMVEYTHSPNAKLKESHWGPLPSSSGM